MKNLPVEVAAACINLFLHLFFVTISFIASYYICDYLLGTPNVGFYIGFAIPLLYFTFKDKHYVDIQFILYHFIGKDTSKLDPSHFADWFGNDKLKRESAISVMNACNKKSTQLKDSKNKSLLDD